MLVLSHLQAAILMQARRENRSSQQVSPDLGLSQVDALLNGEGVYFPTIGSIDWDQLAGIASDPSVCYQVIEGEAAPIRVYSRLFDRLYSLYPTASAPTMLVSGIPMHRIKDTDPWQDTISKLRALGGAGGRLLDTCTGLGYTAIQAAQTAHLVVSVELDPAAGQVASQNPWSHALFIDPRIQRVIGDSAEVIVGFPDGYFSVILNDPPAFSLAGELYSLAFYRQAYRVLKPNGRLFHYLGNPHSKSGRSLTRSSTLRLRQAGFRGVEPRPQAFGVVAYK